ncbi:peptide-methionine (S)-S-oxide reductase MsrA [Macrococcus equi]|uniref:peptide-methionine (S)-S-oxide reductase MsrA n=1 Tax=Macrococcus equi TaxID=3395462 RepID=UPI0039BE85CD
MTIATFAGGCFWCMVKPFDRFDGVKKVISGYSGGHKEHPTYEEVCSNTTGHREAVQITYDESVISYREIVEIFFKTFDPTDAMGQFGDRGESYKPAIFYHSNEQKEIALTVIEELDEKKIFNAPIITPVIPYKNFFPAEEYHQDFYKKNPQRYQENHQVSGRSDFLEKHWN